MSNEPRLATAVLVTTGDAENLRILLVERSATLRFFGGYWAFPGGAFEACDQIGEQLAFRPRAWGPAWAWTWAWTWAFALAWALPGAGDEAGAGAGLKARHWTGFRSSPRVSPKQGQ